MGAAVAGEQARPRPDVGAGQFQVAAAPASPVAGAAGVEVPAVAVPLELGFGQVGDEVVLGPAGRLQVGAAAVSAVGGVDVVFDEGGAGGRFGPDGPGVLAVLLEAAVVGGALAGGFGIRGALAALHDPLELGFDLPEPAPQLGVLRFELGDAFQQLRPVVHGRSIFGQAPSGGKMDGLTVTSTVSIALTGRKPLG